MINIYSIFIFDDISNSPQWRLGAIYFRPPVNFFVPEETFSSLSVPSLKPFYEPWLYNLSITASSVRNEKTLLHIYGKEGLA